MAAKAAKRELRDDEKQLAQRADDYENKSSDGAHSSYKVEKPAEEGGHTRTVQERGAA